MSKEHQRPHWSVCMSGSSVCFPKLLRYQRHDVTPLQPTSNWVIPQKSFTCAQFIGLSSNPAIYKGTVRSDVNETVVSVSNRNFHH